jgi:hypothetical protein
MDENGDKKKSNGLNWPTVALIIASGGANLIGTQQKGNQLSYEQQEALQKIRELHKGLDAFEDRQRQEIDGIHNVLENQTRILNSQQDVLKHIKPQ